MPAINAHLSHGSRRTAATWCLALLAAALALPATAAGPELPEIRTSATNVVPACVTPERLTAFLRARNPKLAPRFAGIADWYKRHGEALQVRWDYAFFQMAVETNFLTYQRGDGRMGDVDPKQNNFAGIGTTGGGVPGDKFPDVKTGVLAQFQHLLVYAGEHVAAPVAARTRLKQDDILEVSRKLGRPVRFSDLARRWAADPHYARTIAAVAEQFRQGYCHQPQQQPMLALSGAGGAPKARTAAAKENAAPRDETRKIVQGPAPLTRSLGPAQQAPEPPRETGCRIEVASYGGTKTVLIRDESTGGTRFVALSVVEGFEQSMVDGFIRHRAPGATAIGEFPSREAALAKAAEFCSGDASAPGPVPRAG